MSNSYTTHRRQLYMLPTKAGWIFSLMVFSLFLASVKFSHQATFLLTFLMCGLGVVSSLHTQKNINKITFNVKKSPPVFVNENTEFPCVISHNSDSHRQSLWLICENFQECFDLAVNSERRTQITLKMNKRGYFKIPPISITSHYPIGILFGWSRGFEADINCLVYPEPKDIINQPDSCLISNANTNVETMQQSSQQNGEQVSSLKPYQIGDSLRDIHWPSLAKTNTLVTKEYENGSNRRLIFKWSDVSSLDTEDKLCQLSYWILQSEKHLIDYQLSIPGFESPFTHGTEQMHACLTKLALWRTK